jgi:hypothetical protein
MRQCMTSRAVHPAHGRCCCIADQAVVPMQPHVRQAQMHETTVDVPTHPLLTPFCLLRHRVCYQRQCSYDLPYPMAACWHLDMGSTATGACSSVQVQLLPDWACTCYGWRLLEESVQKCLKCKLAIPDTALSQKACRSKELASESGIQYALKLHFTN